MGCFVHLILLGVGCFVSLQKNMRCFLSTCNIVRIPRILGKNSRERRMKNMNMKKYEYSNSEMHSNIRSKYEYSNVRIFVPILNLYYFSTNVHRELHPDEDQCG